MQERRNFIANALEFRLSCTHPSIWNWWVYCWFTKLFTEVQLQAPVSVMTSSNESIFRVIGPLWGEPTGHSDTELWCFLWFTPEQTVEQAIEMLGSWDAIALIVASLYCQEHDTTSHCKIPTVLFWNWWHFTFHFRENARSKNFLINILEQYLHRYLYRSG